MEQYPETIKALIRAFKTATQFINENLEKTAEILSQELSINYAELIDEMKSRSRFMYIKRKISPSETDKIQTFIDDGKLPGITLEPEYGRNYPEKKV